MANRGRTLAIADAVWNTGRGLRIGDRTGQIRRRYSRASLHHGLWWLATANLPFGPRRNPVTTVAATTHAGRVNAFDIWVGAQGD
jgi:hypothetical protein